jgi:hypothetical protein
VSRPGQKHIYNHQVKTRGRRGVSSVSHTIIAFDVDGSAAAASECPDDDRIGKDDKPTFKI